MVPRKSKFQMAWSEKVPGVKKVIMCCLSGDHPNWATFCHERYPPLHLIALNFEKHALCIDKAFLFPHKNRPFCHERLSSARDIGKKFSYSSIACSHPTNISCATTVHHMVCDRHLKSKLNMFLDHKNMTVRNMHTRNANRRNGMICTLQHAFLVSQGRRT